MKFSAPVPSWLKNLLLVFYFIVPNYLAAQTVNIIPRPNLLAMGQGTFSLTSSTVINVSDSSLQPLAVYLQQYIKAAAGFTLPPGNGSGQAAVRLIKNPGTGAVDAYTLNVSPRGITIGASGDTGIFYGIISLLQMVRTCADTSGTVTLPVLTITDRPRYRWRGFMLDESRHFFGMKKVEQLLDWMAFYKLNKFHWHLTDAHGWRIQVKQYPRLTTVGATGNYTDTLAPAAYYTQDEIKAVVAYAHDRFIDVIPEIDMPGHATAANRAYPQYSGGGMSQYPNFTFDPANDSTYTFLGNVLKEVNGLFPYHMIHLGGDEVAMGIQAWAGRPAIMELMKKDSLHALSDLEHYFFRRMADTVYKLGSKTLCWDEAAESGLSPAKTIIFWWRQNIPGSLQIALKNNYQVVLCPRLPLYFDFVQDRAHVAGRKWDGLFNPLGNVYNFPERQLLPAQYNQVQVAGIQANLWTETIGSEKRLDYMIFPRMAALAEAAWTDSVSKNEALFNEHLKAHLRLYDDAGIYYYNPFDPAFHPEAIDFRPDHKGFPLKARHRHTAKHLKHVGRHKKAHAAHKQTKRAQVKSRKRR